MLSDILFDTEDTEVSHNPLNYVSIADLVELGLTINDIKEAYQPSAGGVFHARGAEGKGKTLLVAHDYKRLIDGGYFKPSDAVGNMSFKGKYGDGYQVLKGDNLRQYLWDLTHKPYKNKIVIIDEIDSEFPARSWTSKEQTEIALRLWHTAKLHNFVYMTSHIGNSADVIIHLATHYYLFPDTPDFVTNTMDFFVANALDWTFEDWTAYDIIKTMLIYSRRELTEDMDTEQYKPRPVKKQQDEEEDIDLDLEAEMKEARRF